MFTTGVRAIVVGATLFATGLQAQRAGPPSIVVIVADDMGYADIGAQGGKEIPTPNIDALAAGGTRFTDAYVSGPYCSPTRAGLLTGKYPQRFGHEFNIGMIDQHRDAGLPLTEVTMADRLKAAGYRTALIGKWHLGAAPQFFPTKRGFDEFFGFLPGAHGYMGAQANVNPIYDGDEKVPQIPYLTDTLAARAAEFITRNRANPFFLYLAFNAVHAPLQATEKYLARFPGIADERRKRYAAMLSAMDDGIGRAMAALRDAGLEENTLVFFSDNGGPLGEEAWNGSSNAPLRGQKAQTYEGGIRVPFIVQWRGHLPAGKTYTRPIIQLDVLPTALSAAGIPVQAAWKLDGVDLLPYIRGASAGAPHDVLYWRLGSVMAIRQGSWKLVQWHPNGAQEDPATLSLKGAQLFNLASDIGETTDLAASEPQRVKQLGEAWMRWRDQLSPPKWNAPGAARVAIRACPLRGPADPLVRYAGTWEGNIPGVVRWTWVQHADSSGSFMIGRDTVPTPTRIAFATSDSVILDVTRPLKGMQGDTRDVIVQLVAQACGDAMAGTFIARSAGGPIQRSQFDATRTSPP